MVAAAGEAGERSEVAGQKEEKKGQKRKIQILNYITQTLVVEKAIMMMPMLLLL